ncbi:MAG TPA: FadR family transcriptional regulator [Aliiroseovarius sp.]|nr:FadR family transcriptional regulator [Aliiroseovarius sp.]
MTKPDKRARVGKNIIDRLGCDICQDAFDDGGTLPNEADLALRYGVSRTVIREALNVVQSKGLISRKARVGTTINARDSWNILDEQVLTWLGDTIDDTDLLASVIEARRLIEPAAAAKAATRAELSEIAALEDAWRAMAAAGDNRAGFIAADITFHQILLKASHNRVFQQLGTALQAATRFGLRQSGHAARDLDDAIATHGALVEALRLRDAAGASRITEQLLDLALRDLARPNPPPA